jgi:nitrite reductase/ring-hydroxylating ferredoxin subunit
MHEYPSAQAVNGDCQSCPLATRRAFLRDVAAVLAATLGMSRLAAALPALRITETTALRQGKTASYSIAPTDGVQIDRDNQVILVRWENAMYAFNLACPHQNTALRWDDIDHQFQCPKHHSRYTPDGTFVSGRATRGMDRFSIRREDATVVVELDALHEQTKDPAAWSAAFVKVA